MGVYIKGMQMPKECLDCPMCDINDDCVLQEDKRFDTWEEQKNGCPLVEIKKPHGRLIDGDAIRANYSAYDYIYYIYGVPTVIEAEWGDDDERFD